MTEYDYLCLPERTCCVTQGIPRIDKADVELIVFGMWAEFPPDYGI